MKKIVLLAVMATVALFLGSCGSGKSTYTIPPKPNADVVQNNVDAIKSLKGSYVTHSKTFEFWDRTATSHEEEVKGGVVYINDFFEGEKIVVNNKTPILYSSGPKKGQVVEDENGDTLFTDVLSEVVNQDKDDGKTSDLTVHFIVAVNDTITKSYDIDFAKRPIRPVFIKKKNFMDLPVDNRKRFKKIYIEKSDRLVFSKYHNEKYYFYVDENHIKSFIQHKMDDFKDKSLLYVDDSGLVYAEKGNGKKYFFYIIRGHVRSVSEDKKDSIWIIDNKYYIKLLKSSDFDGDGGISLGVENIKIDKDDFIFTKKGGKIFYFFESGGEYYPLSSEYKDVTLGKFFAEKNKNKEIKTYRAVSKQIGK